MTTPADHPVDKMQRWKHKDKPPDPHREYLDAEFSEEEEERRKIYEKNIKRARVPPPLFAARRPPVSSRRRFSALGSSRALLPPPSSVPLRFRHLEPPFPPPPSYPPSVSYDYRGFLARLRVQGAAPGIDHDRSNVRCEGDVCASLSLSPLLPDSRDRRSVCSRRSSFFLARRGSDQRASPGSRVFGDRANDAHDDATDKFLNTSRVACACACVRARARACPQTRVAD